MRSPLRRSLLAVTLAIAAFAGSGALTEADQSAPAKQQQVKVIPAQQGTNNCLRRIHVPEYRNNAQRIYHQTGRVWPKQLYRLLHMRRCAVNSDARLAMDKITIRQRQARIRRHELELMSCGSPSCNRRLGQHMAAHRGWVGEQWRCLDTLWGSRESGWRSNAANPSGAYGIPQALPGSKMGPGWESEARVQIRWGLGYIRGRYSNPCGALSHSYATNWY